MAGKITLWGANEFLRCLFTKTAEPPQNFYLALVTSSPPTPYISGSELTEPDVSGYARAEIPNDFSNWSNNGQMHVMSTEKDISFIQATEDWGTVRHWALCNAPAGGFVYFFGALEAPVSVFAGDTVRVSADDISVSLGPFYTSDGI